MIPAEERQTILATIEADNGFLREFVEDFLHDISQDIEDLNDVIAKGDGKELERLAHSMKSVVGFFKAMTPYQMAKELEYLGKDNDFKEAHIKFDTFKATLEELKGILVAAL